MITVGYTGRKKTAERDDEKFSRAGEILTSAGLGLMAALLIVFLPPEEAGMGAEDAVYVMSAASEAVSADEPAVESSVIREELAMPGKSTSAEGEVSFFEIIGEFFAEMIFGEG